MLASIPNIRKSRYPLIDENVPKLIDLQAALLPIEIKLDGYLKSGMQDADLAPTEADRAAHARLQTALTEEVKIFSEKFLAQFRPIAAPMDDLKEKINQYIYRPLGPTATIGSKRGRPGFRSRAVLDAQAARRRPAHSQVTVLVSATMRKPNSVPRAPAAFTAPLHGRHVWKTV